MRREVMEVQWRERRHPDIFLTVLMNITLIKFKYTECQGRQKLAYKYNCFDNEEQ